MPPTGWRNPSINGPAQGPDSMQELLRGNPFEALVRDEQHDPVGVLERRAPGRHDRERVLVVDHPDYGALAARIEVSNLQKSTAGDFGAVTEQLAAAGLLRDEYLSYVRRHREAEALAEVRAFLSTRERASGLTARTTSRICSGPMPQHPPTARAPTSIMYLA